MKVFNRFCEKVPKYDKRYSSSLFDFLTQKGGGSQEKMKSVGKQFENNYELYIYAFFLGYYNKYKKPLGRVHKTDFSHPIGRWGFKARSLDRKNHTWVQKALFLTAVNDLDDQIISYDKGDLSLDEMVSAIINVVEEYTNGGLEMLEEKIEDGLNLMKSEVFLETVIESVR